MENGPVEGRRRPPEDLDPVDDHSLDRVRPRVAAQEPVPVRRRAPDVEAADRVVVPRPAVAAEELHPRRVQHHVVGAPRAHVDDEHFESRTVIDCGTSRTGSSRRPPVTCVLAAYDREPPTSHLDRRGRVARLVGAGLATRPDPGQLPEREEPRCHEIPSWAQTSDPLPRRGFTLVGMPSALSSPVSRLFRALRIV